MKNKFNWPLINDNITEADKKALVDFLQTPNVRFTQSKKVKEFEERWSEWLGVKHSVFVNSGASANYIMVSILRELRGVGEVIVPPIGWVSDVAPLVNLGMTPVFVDVELDNMAISAENIEKAINKKTKAITLVHALGFNALNEEILKLAEKHDLILIEDCCEAHGAKHGDKRVGSIGHMSNFSFYFGHHITTVEGGMVCTDDDNIYELAKMFRSHGMIRDCSEKTRDMYANYYPFLNPLFTFAVPGYNMRNCEMNAVLGLEQLKKLDYVVDARSNNLDLWLSCLDSEKYFTDFSTEGSSNFALPLILKEQDPSLFNKVCALLEKEGVEYRKGTAGGGTQTRQPYLSKYKHDVIGILHNADHIHDYGLYIGNHHELEGQQIANLAAMLGDME